MQAVKDEVRNYNAARYIKCDQFGKRVFPCGTMDAEQPFWLLEVTPAVHYCMGGIAIDENAQVIYEGLRVVG